MKLRTHLWLALVIFAAMGSFSQPASFHPNVVLIVLDTFRADRFGRLSEDGIPLTSQLVSLSRDSAIFSHAFAQLPFTLSSVMSLFTGLYPDVHGVNEQGKSLRISVSTLPQILHEAGYASAGIVSNRWLDPRFGFGRGFESYELIPDQLTYGTRVNEAVFRFLESRKAQEPFFLFLHYMDPHSDWETRKNTLPYYCPPQFVPNLPRLESEFCNEHGHCATDYLLDADTDGAPVSSDKLQELTDFYNCSIRYTDHQLGILFRQMKQRGIYEDSLIIVTGDHGEEFREHGLFIHSQPYDETIAVPLLMKFPRQQYAGRVVSDLVESIDILPTLLDYLNLPHDSHLQGRSLMALLKQQKSEAKSVLSRDKLRDTRYALRTADYKLIHEIRTQTEELYDLKKDPLEKKDISRLNPGQVERMRDELLGMVILNLRLAKKIGAVPEGNFLTRSQRERLRSIGYLE